MPRGRGGRLELVLPALGGAAFALTLPPLGWWPLGWFALAPFALAPSFRTGFAAGFAFHAVGLHWIYQTARFAQVPVPGALLAWAALAAVLALNWAVVGALSRGRSPLYFAAAWTAVAALTGWWTPRLAGDLPAYSQWPNLALIQAGSWGGPHLLGFVVVWANASWPRPWRPLAAAALLWVAGAWTLSGRVPAGGPTVRILQPNVDQYQKWDPSRAKAVMANLNELASRNAELNVWPETAIPHWQSRTQGRPGNHLVGIIAEEGPANALQSIQGGTVRGVYLKRELVPFGEFVPFRSLVPRFFIDHWLRILDQFGDMERGAPVQPLLPTPFGPAAATICYEAMFPRLTRADAARGAAWIVNVTNDGWYKDTWGPYQHFQANVYRAIETRLPVVRSGNTGISAVIDPWGVIVAKLDLNTRGALEAPLPAGRPAPLYVRFGDWFGALCVAAAVFLRWRK